MPAPTLPLLVPPPLRPLCPGPVPLQECNAAIHKKCIDKIIGRCTGTATNSRDTIVSWAQGVGVWGLSEGRAMGTLDSVEFTLFPHFLSPLLASCLGSLGLWVSQTLVEPCYTNDNPVWENWHVTPYLRYPSPPVPERTLQH